MPIFGVLIYGLVGALATALPAIVARILVALGIGAVVYTGFDFILDQIVNQVIANFSSIGGLTAQVIGILNVDTAVNIIMSAYSIRMTYKFSSGAFKQVGFK